MASYKYGLGEVVDFVTQPLRAFRDGVMLCQQEIYIFVD